MAKYCGIYKLFFTDFDRVYIGSSKNIDARKRSHLCMLSLNTHHCKHLQHAYNKNSDSLKFEIVELCNPENIEEREQIYIDWYSELNLLYNSAPKANCVSGYKWSDQQKALHSERIKKVFEDPIKAKKILSANALWRTTDESKLVFSKAHKKAYENPVYKAAALLKLNKMHEDNRVKLPLFWKDKTESIILIYSNGLNYYHEFDNCNRAALHFGIEHSLISKCCKKQVHLIDNKYIFIYKKDYSHNNIQERIKNALKNFYNGKARKVIKLYKDSGEPVCEYSSLTIAANENGINVSNLSRACNGKIKSLAGFKWKYAV